MPFHSTKTREEAKALCLKYCKRIRFIETPNINEFVIKVDWEDNVDALINGIKSAHRQFELEEPY